MNSYAQLTEVLNMLYANEARFKHIKVVTKFDGFLFTVIYYDKNLRQTFVRQFYPMEAK